MRRLFTLVLGLLFTCWLVSFDRLLQSFKKALKKRQDNQVKEANVACTNRLQERLF
jgi:hypothetical protein